MKKTVVKVLRPGMGEIAYSQEWDGRFLFVTDAALDAYDWLLVYDEVPHESWGRLRRGKETLACPSSRTILVTAEPPSIKLYAPAYLAQFGYVLTTHPPEIVRHPGYRLGRGCLSWFYSRPYAEYVNKREFPKTEDLSTVCSSKAMKHTSHNARLNLVRELARELPGLQWFGHGVRPIQDKAEALEPFRYHLAIENHIAPHHWTEKLADAFLAACLPFYAGDPAIFEIFPEESLIPIPMNDPGRAAAIIRRAVEENEYQKRLPAILEARRLVLTRYNFWAQAAATIDAHEAAAREEQPTPGACIRSRHNLRFNPLHIIGEWADIARCRRLRRSAS